MCDLTFKKLILATIFMSGFAYQPQAAVYTLDLALSGEYEVLPNPSTATGILIGTYDNVTNVLDFTMMFNGLTGPTTSAHFHKAGPGMNGPVQIGLVGFPLGVTSGYYSDAYVLTPEQETDLLCGLWYINIHTTAYPGGEIRSQLKEGMTIGELTPLGIGLTGLKEVLPNASPATGILTGTYDAATNLLSIHVMFNGLAGTSTAAHIHNAGPEQNGPVIIPLDGFPLGVTSGAYAHVFLLTPEHETALLSGNTYINIHTTFLPGGEIRGQLMEGTLTGDCGASAIPLSNWALSLGALLIAAFTVFMMRNRS